MKFKHLFFALMAIVAVSSCKSQYETLLNSNDVNMKYDAALDYYNQGKF